MLVGLCDALPASIVQMELHVRKEKVLQGNTARQSLTLAGPKNAGTKSKVARTQETMLLERTRRSDTLSGKESAELNSESPNRKKSCCKSRRVVQETPRKDAGVTPTEAFVEKIFLVLFVTLRSQLWSKR